MDKSSPNYIFAHEQHTIPNLYLLDLASHWLVWSTIQGTKRITGQYSLLRTSAPQEVLVRTGQHWSVYTREASEIFKLSGC